MSLQKMAMHRLPTHKPADWLSLTYVNSSSIAVFRPCLEGNLCHPSGRRSRELLLTWSVPLEPFRARSGLKQRWQFCRSLKGACRLL